LLLGWRWSSVGWSRHCRNFSNSDSKRSKRLSKLPLSELTALMAVVGWTAAIWSVNSRSWKVTKAVQMGSGILLRNNDPTTSS
ncbi:hypothetical protein T12_8716, partial [Trichinella patagoniensis]